MAERRAGQILASMPKKHGARPADAELHDATPSFTDLGNDAQGRRCRGHEGADLREGGLAMSEQGLTETDADALVPELPLTPREEAFCVAFGDPESLHYGRPTKAAVAAGYPEKSAWNTAWKLRRRPRIIARLAEFQAAATAAASKVLSDLENTRLQALAAGDWATSARCSQLQGQALGIFYERNILSVDNTPVYDERAALDARRITRILLTMPPDPDLLPEVPQLPVVVEAVPAPPARATPEQIERAQAPQTRQERK